MSYSPSALAASLVPNIRIETVSDRPVSGPCWTWTASRTKGYGATTVDGKRVYVHRLTYAALVGEIPSGLEIDHLCLNKACCNPAHLEPVTHRENMIRYGRNKPVPTHCANEHPLTKDNLATRPNGRWRCRECTRIASRATKARRRRASGAFKRGTGVCANGHALDAVGRYGSGNRCAQCGRDRAARYRARLGQLELVAAI